MNIKTVLAVLLAGTSMAPVAFGGSAIAPEITDPAESSAVAELDIRKAWVTNDAGFLVFTIEVDDLNFVQPTDHSVAQIVYAVTFSVSSHSKPVFAEGIVSFAETTSTPLAREGQAVRSQGTYLGIGTTFRGGDNDRTPTLGEVKLDPATDTITIKMSRASNIVISTGAVVSGITVNTYTATQPAYGQPVSGLKLDGRALVDTATTVLTYIVG